jgi:chaperonin GroES
MKGFNPGAVIPKRDLKDVRPLRFNLIVKIRPEKEESEYIVMPDSVKKHRDTTRGWIGTVMAVGESIPKMKKLFGVIKRATVCLFDESVSIDDPNRCFDWGEDRFVMFDVETVMGILRNGHIDMLGDRVLVRKPKRDDFKVTKSKLWIPAGNEKQEVGGVVVEYGPGVYSHTRNKYLPMDIRRGDFVLFPKYGHTDIKIDGIDYAVIRQDKVLAIVDGEAERLQFA